MYEHLLEKIGLSADEASIYEVLLQHGPQSANFLGGKLKKIKKGLLYKVLDRLIERGLVLAEKKQSATIFAPQSPELLGRFLSEQEHSLQLSREALNVALPELKAKFNLSTERPMIRFFEGVDGLRAMLDDKIQSGAKELYFVRSARAQVYNESFGKWFSYYLKRQAEAMKVFALTVDDEEANHDPAYDAARNVVRTWLRPEDYTTPIEIDAYADRVAIISYGKEIFGVLIEHAPIAQAMRELLQLADKGAKTLKVLHDHPKAKDVRRLE